MNPALRHSAAHVFVESLQAPELHPDDAHHLLRVLRLRDGEVVTVTDGNGSWRPVQLSGGVLVPTGSSITEPGRVPLTVASAIPKGDRLDWMVQKLTELGVGRIVLLHCDRSVVRWDADRAARQLARLRKVAREAAMQSRRTRLPEIIGPAAFADIVTGDGVVLADPDGVAPSALEAPPAVVLIGPEGGFSAEEFSAAVPRVCLSEHILRVETAALLGAVTFLT